jgi:hypothetical protein
MVILTLIHSLCYRVAMKLNFDIKKCFEIIQKSNMSKSCLTEEIGLQSVQYYIEHFHVFEARWQPNEANCGLEFGESWKEKHENKSYVYCHSQFPRIFCSKPTVNSIFFGCYNENFHWCWPQSDKNDVEWSKRWHYFDSIGRIQDF